LLQNCDKTNHDSADFDVQFAVPETVSIKEGAASMEFRVMFGKAPLYTDKIVLGDPSGKLNTCNILSVSSSKFSISLYKGIVSGLYNVYVQRGILKKQIGKMTVKIDYSGGGGDIEVVPSEGSTVYGVVVCDGMGVKDVVVSDGVECR